MVSRVPHLSGVVLAAGKGTRMKSPLPKVLHRVCGVPMADLAGRAMKEAGVEVPILVVGHGKDEVIEALGDGYDYVEQAEQKGTGHAMACAMERLPEDGFVFVAPGDAPLIEATVYCQMLEAAKERESDCVLAVALLDDPFGYGRIIRDAGGSVVRIIEEPDATDEIRAIREVCTSFYLFRIRVLRDLIRRLRNDNAKGEYYLTDMPELIHKAGGRTETITVRDFNLLKGVNDRWQLAQASQTLRERILKRHAENGVSIEDPSSTYVEFDVEIGANTTLHPMTVIEGRSRIGVDCEIGPSSRIVSTEVGEAVTIMMSHVNRARIGDGCRIGPFANIRPHTELGKDVKVGNFVELKNAIVRDGASLSHLTYVGDATVGARANIGAGTITCNFDGFDKHRTEIGDDAFVGSNSTLVAPVTIGEGAMTAAGSTITEDVPDGALGMGRSRQVNKENWAEQWRKRKQQRRESKAK